MLRFVAGLNKCVVYHISQLSDDSGLEMLGWDDECWNVVLRFVAGLLSLITLV